MSGLLGSFLERKTGSNREILFFLRLPQFLFPWVFVTSHLFHSCLKARSVLASGGTWGNGCGSALWGSSSVSEHVPLCEHEHGVAKWQESQRQMGEVWERAS